MRRTISLALVIAAALTARQARALEEYPESSGPSFWDPANWYPNATPGAGDTVQLGGGHVGFSLYLGDVTGGPSAQTAEISRLYFAGPNGFRDIFWGSNFAGGNSGGLTFSQDDGSDPNVGIRVGWTAPTAQNVLFLWDAEIPASSPVNISLGSRDPLSQPSEPVLGNRLSLASTVIGPSAPVHTVNAGIVNLESSYSFLEIDRNARLAADSLTTQTHLAAGYLTTGSQVSVLGGELSAVDASFTLRGSANTPLVVDQGGTADFGNLGLFIDNTGGPGSSATVRVLDGTLTVNDASFVSDPGATVSLEVIGGRVASAGAGGEGIALAGNSGSAVVSVSGGGRLSGTTSVAANDFYGTPGDARLVASDPNTVVEGSVSLYLAGTSTGSVRFDNGASCLGCELNITGGHLLDSALVLGKGSVATVLDTVEATFETIQLAPETTSFAIRNSTPALSTVDVSVGALNVGSDFALRANGSTAGGDLVSTGGAQLTVNAGTRLRIGIAGPADPPLLAIGSGGSVTLDPHGAAFIGSPATPDDFRDGKLVVGVGGSLYGKGRIDGAGFPTGTSPDLVNKGGAVHPGFSPGTLTIDGHYLQESGLLELEIGGVGPGEFDVLDATLGATFLGGTIRFERLDGFLGELGAQLDFFAGRPVSFDPSVSFEDDTGLGLQFDLATGVATITHVVPEPPLAALLLACAVPLMWLRRLGA